ncbi:MAG: sigma factor-like helix-turn-helix DNA-binding protein, partial [Thermoleophilaceae bacterium]
MATFDQLAADQRAIIELVLRQDRSYEQIGEMLDLPPARVRELARDALGELAPFTAEFVDPQWRGQLADYVLGQQTGPESQATRGHLRRSEPARIWAYSLLDALDDFYADGDRPEIPVGEAGGRAARAPARERPAPSNGEAPTAPLTAPLRARMSTAGLSPAARTALMRRRIIGGLIGAVVIAVLVFGGIAIFGGGGGKKKSAAATSTTKTAAQGQGQIAAQAILAPVGTGNKGDQGVALVYQSGQQSLLVLRAKLKPTTGSNKYVIWLYNSEKQLTPVAADVTDKQGNFQGAQRLPA